ncbi:MAG: hypothetical protein KGY74_05315 [Candidatus Cloacimonetes bacterium]|nr:hypothetical protein [Candidatus Cloacimonadota bacterium]
MTNQERIEAIDSKIDEIVTTPKMSYKIGDKQVDWDSYYNFLLKQKKALQENRDSEISVVEFDDMAPDEFGRM